MAKSQQKPNVIVLGTGRDGTVSMFHFLTALFGREGKGRNACHEFSSREFYNRFDMFARSGDESEMDVLREIFKTCPFDAVIGNGYAFTLSKLRDALPRDTALIHLKRDRDACIRSLIKHCELFPEAHGYYSPRRD